LSPLLVLAEGAKAYRGFFDYPHGGAEVIEVLAWMAEYARDL
jgi:hypothetical protein